jgi:phage-related protein
VAGVKELVVMGGEIQTPPLPSEARREAGFLLWMLQKGETLAMPQSRPMPSIGPGCHELRIAAENTTWRIVYMIHELAVVILEVFSKKTNKTPDTVIKICRHRRRDYLNAVKETT